MGKLRGYQIMRTANRGELMAFNVRQGPVLGVVVGDGIEAYVLSADVDLLALGLLCAAGSYQLIPVDVDGRPLWKEAVGAYVSEEVAWQQRCIVMSFYRALQRLLPQGSPGLDTVAVLDSIRDDLPHPVLGHLRRAAIQVWTEERRGAGLVDQDERARLIARVARLAAASLQRGGEA